LHHVDLRLHVDLLIHHVDLRLRVVLRDHVDVATVVASERRVHDVDLRTLNVHDVDLGSLDVHHRTTVPRLHDVDPRTTVRVLHVPPDRDRHDSARRHARRLDLADDLPRDPHRTPREGHLEPWACAHPTTGPEDFEGRTGGERPDPAT
jgi:hypothetical protein